MDALYVVGAGGIGCALGYALAAAGGCVTFIEADPAKIDHGNAHGVAVGRHPPLPARFETFADWHPAPGATVFLCTKCYDNAAVLDHIDRMPGLSLIPVQNGFDPALESRTDFVWEGIASFVSECLPGRPHTRITRGGRLHLGRRQAGGPADTVPPALTLLQFGLRKLRGIRVIWVEDIPPYKYTKLMYHPANSPLAAA